MPLKIVRKIKELFFLIEGERIVGKVVIQSEDKQITNLVEDLINIAKDNNIDINKLVVDGVFEISPLVEIIKNQY